MPNNYTYRFSDKRPPAHKPGPRPPRPGQPKPPAPPKPGRPKPPPPRPPHHHHHHHHGPNIPWWAFFLGNKR